MSKPLLCLNMIVRNEADRILRALESVRPHISSFAILDTGSTDDTVELIRMWGEKCGIPGIVGKGLFVNFSQARNQALSIARSWHRKQPFEYLLLMDADMELVVEDPDGLNPNTATAWEMLQVAGGMSYNNTRLLNATSSASYNGVTHEYLDAPTAGCLKGAYFRDHADGSNRADKFERDIRLLREDLERDPLNPRSWFYLANSYREQGDHAQAAAAYRKRVELGGWDEEVWNAQVHLAGSLLRQGLEDAFVKEALVAYQMRPQRAEVLHDIAKHYRLKGANHAAMLFVEKGIGMERPDDKLFVSDWVYNWGFRQEYAISGYYQPETREKAFKIANALALDLSVPVEVRNEARTNMAFYLPKLEQFCPSVEYKEIAFSPNRGFTAMNPSVTLRPTGRLEVLLRTVNYKINEAGQYMIGDKGCQDAPIETENWLLQLSDDLWTRDYARVAWGRPPAKFPLVIGLEDMRIFWHKGVRCFSACVREQSEWGQCEQWAGRLTDNFEPNLVQVDGALRISYGTKTEKNWMPITNSPSLEWMYNLHTRVNDVGMFAPADTPQAVENIRGSSQLIPFQGGYLAVVHEALVHPNTGKRVYQHRFVKYTRDLTQYRLSLPFVFQGVQIEFCAGLAPHPNMKDFVISFGVRDERAMLAKLSGEEIAMMFGAHHAR